MTVRRLGKLPQLVCGVVAASALALTGCSSAAPGSSSNASGQGNASAKVLRLNYGEEAYSAATLEAFEKQHPDIKVEVTHKTLTFEDGSVQTDLRSGQGADVLLVNSGPGRVGALAKAGLLADLNDVYDQGARKRYPKDILEQINHDGKIYEVVEGRDVFEVHYNKKLFEKAGVEPPKTWDEMLATCKPLAAIGVQPMAVGARNNFQGGWLLGTLIESSAGSATMKDLLFGDGSFAQPSVVDGAKKLKQLIDSGCINHKKALALDEHQAEASFGQSKAAMMVETEHMNADLEQDKIDTSNFGSFPMPSNTPANVHPTSGLAVSWVVNAKSPSMDAAKDWIRWVSSEDYLKIAAENGYIFAPAQLVSDSVQLDPSILKAVKDVNAGTGYNPSVYLSADAKTAWYDAVQSLLSKPNQDPKPLMQAIDKSK